MFSEAFVCPQGGVSVRRLVSVRTVGGTLCHGDPPRCGGRVGGAHPTRMHSCYHLCMWVGNVFGHVSLSVCVSVCSGYNF